MRLILLSHTSRLLCAVVIVFVCTRHEWRLGFLLELCEKRFGVICACIVCARKHMNNYGYNFSIDVYYLIWRYSPLMICFRHFMIASRWRRDSSKRCSLRNDLSFHRAPKQYFSFNSITAKAQNISCSEMHKIEWGWVTGFTEQIVLNTIRFKFGISWGKFRPSKWFRVLSVVLTWVNEMIKLNVWIFPILIAFIF